MGLPAPSMPPEGGRLRQVFTAGYEEDFKPRRQHKGLMYHAGPGFRAAAGNAWAMVMVVAAGSALVLVVVLAVRLVQLVVGIDLPGGG
jgi:hypothetical protein